MCHSTRNKNTYTRMFGLRNERKLGLAIELLVFKALMQKSGSFAVLGDFT